MFNKKKKSLVANKKELAALDESVNELSAQTSELLSHFGESTENSDSKASSKPTLPKRSAGKSFDIIHDPKRTTSLKSTLKSRPQKTQVVDEEEIELLPEHATKSFNEIDIEKEVPFADSKTVAKAEVEATNPAHSALVVGHVAGTLHVPGDTPEPKLENESASEMDASQKEAKSPMESRQGIQFNEAKNTEEDAKAEKPGEEDSAENIPTSDVERLNEQAKELASDAPIEKLEEPTKKPEITEGDTGDASDLSNTVETEEDLPEEPAETTSEEPSVKDSGELFANNLVKDAKPNGYEPVEGQQKPTVFDTNEYHPELHDWSKLEHRGGAAWYILALLVAIAGALAYFILSGQSLPFVN